jgi:hypothetical protein
VHAGLRSGEVRTGGGDPATRVSLKAFDSARVPLDSETLSPSSASVLFHRAWLAEAAAVNAALLRRFLQLREAGSLRGSHCFDGRFENLYAERADVPELEPVLVAAAREAERLLGAPGAPFSFWFNAAEPGHRTGLHTHDDGDERLSGVYYVQVPEQSGDLLLGAGPDQSRLRPQAGLLVFFPPDLPHEVEIHRGEGLRLSVAFNFGPPPLPGT